MSRRSSSRSNCSDEPKSGSSSGPSGCGSLSPRCLQGIPVNGFDPAGREDSPNILQSDTQVRIRIRTAEARPGKGTGQPNPRQGAAGFPELLRWIFPSGCPRFWKRICRQSRRFFLQGPGPHVPAGQGELLAVDVRNAQPQAYVAFANPAVAFQADAFEKIPAQIAVADIGVNSGASQRGRARQPHADVVQQGGLIDKGRIRMSVCKIAGNSHRLSGHLTAMMNQNFGRPAAGRIKSMNDGDRIHDYDCRESSTPSIKGSRAPSRTAWAFPTSRSIRWSLTI